MASPAPLPSPVLILGMGWSGRVLAAQLQARGVQVSGTVRDPSSATDDGLQRHRLHADAAPSAALLEAIAQAQAVLCSVQRRLAETQWQALADARGIASAVFRLPGLYGPGRNALLQLAERRARHVVRPGLVFNRLHVEDLAAVVIAAMQRPTRDGLYLPADDEPAPPQDVLAYAAQLGGFPLPAAVAWDDPAVSATLRRFYANNKRIDSRGTRAALGWAPKFETYREGLEELAASLAGHGPASD